MGEIVVTAKLENTQDRGSFEQGYRDEASIRSTGVDAIVDTGAAMLMLPQNVVERLGLKVQRTGYRHPCRRPPGRTVYRRTGNHRALRTVHAHLLHRRPTA